MPATSLDFCTPWPDAARFRGLIFDMDGVITDTEALHTEAERLACEHYGWQVPQAEWGNFKGRTAEAIFGYLIEHFGDARVPVEEVVQLKTAKYLELARAGVPAMPGALAFIAAARPRFERLALSTSSVTPVQRLVFDRFGLDPYFDAVTTGDQLRHGKPHPEAYLVAAERLGLAPADCLVIEDSDSGVRAALAAGCDVVGLTSSYPADFLASVGARRIVASFDELAARLGFTLTA
jgi:HAD superfamily hydrolase (TIGR01509 family)